MDNERLVNLMDFIVFAKDQKIPSFKLDGFECSLPSKDASETALEAMRRDIDALKATCNRLMLALETPATNPYKPFSNRISSVKSNG